MDTMLKAFLT